MLSPEAEGQPCQHQMDWVLFRKVGLCYQKELVENEGHSRIKDVEQNN